MKLLWRDTTPTLGSPNNGEPCANSTPKSKNHHRNRRTGHPNPNSPIRHYGVGVLVAATVLSEVGNPTRYSTKAKFAMANGTAPIEASADE